MNNSTKFRKLTEPGYIGLVRTKNRILKTGSTLGFYPWEGGHIQQVVIDAYETFAKGGVGLITVGGSPFGVPPGVLYSLHDDKYLPGMTRLAETIHKYDCPAFVQMFHIGPMLPPFLAAKGLSPVGASALNKNEMPIPRLAPTKALTIPEIEEIVRQFGIQAERCKKAGFQGIELNAATTHLLNSFLSRGWNKRDDVYGAGSLESRAKIVADIIKEIKRLNGKDFAIIALINGAEPGLSNGTTPEEAQGIARILQAAGADAIHVRVEFYNHPQNPDRRDSTQLPDIAFFPEPTFPLKKGEVDGSRHGAGAGVPPAISIKKSISVPVIAVGRLDVELGEKLLRQGAVDFISLNRRLMADPELPNKIAENRLDDIAPCTGCITCFDAEERGCLPRCQVNAALGKDKEYAIKPVLKKKRIMIIGGGPAGMETARVAALRGHEVLLYDKEPKLGGSMNIAILVKGPEKEDIPGLVRYLKTQISKLGVDIRLGTEVSRTLVEEIKPDVLVIATGGTHDIPDIPGINRNNVVTSRDLHRQLKRYLKFLNPNTIRRLTKFWMPIGKKVVIIGGNIHGCQTAAFLVSRGRKVVIVDTAQTIGDGLLETHIKPLLLDWLEKNGVQMIPGIKYEEITDKGLIITSREGKRQTIEANTIITAMPFLPNKNLVKNMEGVVSEIYAIGDCKEPHLIVDAIAEGSQIARKI